MEERDITHASYLQFLSEERLMGTRCAKCQNIACPPRALCPECGAMNMEWTELEGRGELAAFTAVAVAPTLLIEEGYGRDNPYCFGVVRLSEGPMVSARILGVDNSNPNNIKIGAELKVEYIHREREGEGLKTFLAFRAV